MAPRFGPVIPPKTARNQAPALAAIIGFFLVTKTFWPKLPTHPARLGRMNTNQQPDREKDIFEQAVEIIAPPDRDAFLNVACTGEPALRERIEKLLQAHDDASQFLRDQPAATATVRLPSPLTEKPGDRIGRYKLREKIGEGGCGVVYVADQEEPVRRRVALKIIKPGMDPSPSSPASRPSARRWR